ncbi:MAG: ABC transporter ATP-binding protein [Thermofilaceae archaeon]
MSLLEVNDLSAGYGKVEIINGISFSSNEKEILVVVGPNGSGKSTLLKALFGLCRVFKGEVLFRGEDLTRLPPYRRSMKGVAYLPQVNNVFEGLTVQENLALAAHDIMQEELKDRLENVLSFLPELKGFMQKKVRVLSGGERQMVALAMSLLRNPSLVMFDEPTTALAPRLASQVLKKALALRDDRGVSVLLVEQNARAALEIGDKALLMVSGRIRFLGNAQDLLENKELAKMYLGL